MFFFAIVGRYLLCFKWSKFNLANDKTLNNDVGNKFKNLILIDPSISTKEAMSEAVTKPRRLIGAKGRFFL